MNNFYPVVDCKRLQNELIVFYDRPKIHKGGLVKTLLKLKNNSLSKSLSCTRKL